MYTQTEQSHTRMILPSRAVISRTLSCVAFGMVAVYMVLMVQTISLINQRKEVQNATRDAQVAISGLEVRYFELAQSIDQKTITDMGFTESVIPTFAYTNAGPSYPTVAIR